MKEDYSKVLGQDYCTDCLWKAADVLKQWNELEENED